MFVFPNQAAWLAHQERLKDLRREADKELIINEMRAGRRHPWRRALAWLGRRLEGWGEHLQERYGATTASPVLQAANRTR